MDTKPPSTPPPPRQDPCWNCGYDLADLDTGTCPECGVHFVTGRDLAALHDRLLTGASRRCITCGAPRTQHGITRCPTCGMRYSQGESDPPAPAPSAPNVHGVVARPEIRSPNSSTPTVTTTGARITPLWIIPTLSMVGLALVLSKYFQSSISTTASFYIRFVGIVVCTAVLTWFIVRILRRR